jgi:MATE family multidrug resistance protein
MHSLFHENKRTLILAFPIISSHLGQMLLGLSDTLMIGRIGTVELAASAFVNILIHLIMVLGIGLSVAVAVQVSHAHGKENAVSAADALRHGLVLSIGLGLLSFGALALGQPLLPYLQQPPEMIAILPGYFLWVAASMTFMIPVMVMKSFAEAKNHPWRVFIIQLAGVLLNILLNYWLIFGKAGFPAMGLTGAGLATFIARLATLFAIAIYLLFSKTLAPARPARWFAKLDRKELRDLTRLATPITSQMVMEFGVFSISAVLIGRLGSLPMAAHQIAMTCAATTYMLPMGLSQAVGIRIGHVIGAGQPERCRKITLGAQGMTLLTMGTFAFVYLRFGKEIASLFKPEPDLLVLTVSLLSIAGFFQLFDGIQVVSVGTLRALKDVKVPTLLSFVGYWMIAFPLGIYLGYSRHLGVTGFWAGLGIGLGISACSMSIRLIRVIQTQTR